MQIKDFLTES